MNKQKFFYHFDQLQVLGKCSRILKQFLGKISKNLGKNFPKSSFMILDEVKKKNSLNELIEPVISNRKKFKKSSKIIRKEELKQLKNISSLILRDTMTLKVSHYPQPNQQEYKSLNVGKNAIKEKTSKGVISCQNYFVVTIPEAVLQQNNSLKYRHLDPLQHITKRHFAIIKLKHKSLHKGKMIFYVDCDMLNHHNNKIVERKLLIDSHGGNLLFEDNKNFQKSSGNKDQEKNMKSQCKNSTTNSLITVVDIFKKYDIWHTSIPNFKILCCKMHTNSTRFLRKDSEAITKGLDNIERNQECRSKQHYNDILKLRIKQKSKILMDQLKTAADIVKPAFISENANQKFTKGDVVSKFNNNKFNVPRNNPEDISRNIKKLLNTAKSDIAFNESFNLHKKYIKNEVSSRPFSINSRIWKFNIENLIIPFKTNKELEIKRTWNTFIKKYKLKSKNHNDLTEYKITSKLREIGNSKKETEKEYTDKHFTDDYNCNPKKIAVKSIVENCSHDSGYQEIKSPSLNLCRKSSCRFTIENEELSDDEDEVIKKESNLKTNQSVINKNFRKNIEIIYPISKLNYDDISAFYGNTQQNDSSVKEIVNENNLKTYNTDSYDKKDFFFNLLKKSMKAEDLNEFLDNIKSKKKSANDILIKFCNRLMFISKDVNYFTNVANIKKCIDLKDETDYSTAAEKIKNEMNLKKINLNEVQKKKVMVRFNHDDDDKNSKILVTTTKNIPKGTYLNKNNKGKSSEDEDDDDDDCDNIIRPLRTNDFLKLQVTKSPNIMKNTMEIKRIDNTMDKNIDNIIIKKEKINKSLIHDLLNEGNAFLKFLPIINESLKTYLKSYQNSNLSTKNKIIHKIDRLKYTPFRKLPSTNTEFLKMNLEGEKKLNNSNKNKEKEMKELIVKPSDKEIPTVTKDSLLSTINHENEEFLPNAYSSTNVENIIMKDDLLVLSVKVKIPFSSVLLVLGKKDANFSGRVVAKKINK